MTPHFKVALALSAGLHGAVFVAWPVTSAVEFDVERGATSVEIYLVDPPKTVVSRRLTPDTPVVELKATAAVQPDAPVPQTVITPELRGAVREVLPGYLRNPPPVYPKLARERGYEGTSLLEVQVLPSGRCGALRVLESSNYAVLDEAAADAIRGWRFKPASRGRIPVAVWVEIPVRFQLVEIGD